MCETHGMWEAGARMFNPTPCMRHKYWVGRWFCGVRHSRLSRSPTAACTMNPEIMPTTHDRGVTMFSRLLARLTREAAA